jgi:hypothetical protein
VTKLLQQANIAGIRNGIDHFRDADSFPKSDEILGCLSRLQEAILRADTYRYFPKLYWLTKREGDRFGLVEYEYRDYRDRALKLYGPSAISGTPRNMYQHPVVIASGNLIGLPNAQLRFVFVDQSEYVKYWVGYPRGLLPKALPSATATTTIQSEPS